MYYTLYKVTNNINDKIYVGVHKTNDISDDYMGSGKILKRSIEKYGIENFTKEILEVYDNPEDMFDAEARIVNEEFVADKETYNIKIGGEGGWDYILNNRTKEERITIARKGGLSGGHLNKINNDDEYKKELVERLLITSVLGFERIKELYPEGVWKDKSHTDETKKKIGEANSIHQKGKGNSQYGTRWIHNLELKKSKRIKKEEVIPEEWLEGRKIKF